MVFLPVPDENWTQGEGSKRRIFDDYGYGETKYLPAQFCVLVDVWCVFG